MQDNAVTAKAYYTAIAEKNIAGVGEHLHPNVTFTGPFGTKSGKAIVLEHIKGFMPMFETYTVRTTLSDGNQFVLIYDLGFPAPVGNIPTACLLTFKDGLVWKIELFFDARPFG